MSIRNSSKEGGRKAAFLTSTPCRISPVRGRGSSASMAEVSKGPEEALTGISVESTPMKNSTYQLRINPQQHSAAPPLDVSLRAQVRWAGLFAGIGGIELGLSRSGHETDLLCEIDPAAGAVLDA